MTVYGKSGKTMKPFSHSFHRPWKSLRRLPHSHRHDYYGHESIPKNNPQRGGAKSDAQKGPDQVDKISRTLGLCKRAMAKAVFFRMPNEQSRATVWRPCVRSSNPSRLVVRAFVSLFVSP